ncbi:hypothetical protein BAE44_0010466 [Dichanthelium oligosanthes]|uniref:Factor of DNA methylation 1-5/IDN2 domain-containing protein n=1 Tax=Dichanthelium oligosanthes TaxID=888268 RepID=A0A1E5VTR3_9POAL|nr:hypothetical protein BAE44_0010466 [Dichanthelium oligosanthes]
MLRDQLAVCYPADSCGPTDPLLLVQVTELSCGGFVLGVTWNHAVADGAGIPQFLQAIGELGSGLPSPSVPPVRRDDSLPTRPSVVPVDKLLSLAPFDDLAYLDFTVPWSSISPHQGRLRQPLRRPAVHRVRRRQRLRVAVPHPWRHVRTRRPRLCSSSPRTRAGTSAPSEGTMATARRRRWSRRGAARWRGGDVVELVKKIRDAKEKIPDQFKKKKNEGGDDAQQAMTEQPPALQDRYDMVIMSSWLNLGFDEVDFGSGTPARVTSRIRERAHFPAYGMMPPCKGRDGANVLSVVVKEKHADAFLGELAREEEQAGGSGHMAAGEGDASDGLGERMKLMESKVDSKIFFHNDAVVEYMEIKNMMGALAEEKEKAERERCRAVVATRREILAPVQLELMAAKGELVEAKEELAAVREQLAQRNQEMDEKDDELAALRVRLHEMEVRNTQTEQQNGTEPDPVQIQPTKNEVIDVDDEKLQELRREWGEGPYKSVVDALVERKEYNFDGTFPYDLWNYKEGRKATLADCIEYMIDQMKQLTAAHRRKSRRYNVRAYMDTCYLLSFGMEHCCHVF